MTAIFFFLCMQFMGTPAIAQAQSLGAQFDEFFALDLGTEVKELPGRLEKMMGAIRDLERKCAKAVEAKGPLDKVRVLTRLGEAYLHIHRAMMDFPFPRALDAEQAQAYREKLSELTEPFVEKAGEYLRQALAIAKQADLGDAAVEGARRLLSIVESLSKPSADSSPAPTSADLMKLVLAERARLQACAGKQANAGDPSLQGKMELKVQVVPTGYIANVAVVTKAFEGSDFARCVQDLIRRLRLNPFQGKGVVLDLELTFKDE